MILVSEDEVSHPLPMWGVSVSTLSLVAGAKGWWVILPTVGHAAATAALGHACWQTLFRGNERFQPEILRALSSMSDYFRPVISRGTCQILQGKKGFPKASYENCNMGWCPRGRVRLTSISVWNKLSDCPFRHTDQRKSTLNLIINMEIKMYIYFCEVQVHCYSY